MKELYKIEKVMGNCYLLRCKARWTAKGLAKLLAPAYAELQQKGEIVAVHNMSAFSFDNLYIVIVKPY